MSNGGAQTASGAATYRTGRELGSRSPRSYAAVREPNELVVLHQFSRSADPRAKSTASFVAADGAVSLGTDAMASVVRAARCLAKNWHPNIARIRHVDVAEDELTVATELVDGVTLADLFRAARADAGRSPTSDEPLGSLLSLPILVRILVDVVTGLSGLHGLRDESGAPLGAIHGALSPSNIVVGKDGVARLLDAIRPRPLRVAAGTEAVGYAAPEALDPGATQDARADLHAVGVIMWEALTGRRLYDETDPARVLARQREEDVPRPVLPAGSPFERLADVTMQAMAFEASLRFKTAAELGAALRSIAGTRIASGSVVATRVAELAGERIRARRMELDPSATGKRRATSDRGLPAAKPGSAGASAARARGTAAEAAAAMASSKRAGASAAGASAREGAAPNARESAARGDRETLPPASMDANDAAPASTPAMDLSVRDFLAVGEAPSAPALAAPAPPAAAAPPARAAAAVRAGAPKAPPPKPLPKPAPPIVRKTSGVAATSPVNAPSARADEARSKPSPLRPIIETPIVPALVPPPPPAVVVFEASAVDALAAPASSPMPAPAPAPVQPPAAPFMAAPSFAPPPVLPPPTPSAPESSPAPVMAPAIASAPPSASGAARMYEPDSDPALGALNVHGAITHAAPDSTPDAFTPTGDVIPRDRRPMVGILIGFAAALLLLIGIFTVRALFGGPTTKTATTGAAPTGDTAATAGATGTAATGTATARTTASVASAETPAPTAQPSEPATPDEPATGTATAAAAATATAPEPPSPTAATTTPTPVVTAAPPATTATTATASPGPAVKPPSGPSKPKRPAYEPLGI